MPELKLSKSCLLSNAIMLAMLAHINNGTDIGTDELNTIADLIFSTGNRIGTIKAIMLGFKSLPLCEFFVLFSFLQYFIKIACNI